MYKQTNEAARDEHAVIGGVAGKKVFVIDTNGNVINFTDNAVEIKDATSDTRAVVGDTGLEVVPHEVIPTASTQNNPSFVLGFTGSNLTTITQTIGGTTYTKTLGYTGSDLTSISAWS